MPTPLIHDMSHDEIARICEHIRRNPKASYESAVRAGLAEARVLRGELSQAEIDQAEIDQAFAYMRRTGKSWDEAVKYVATGKE